MRNWASYQGGTVNYSIAAIKGVSTITNRRAGQWQCLVHRMARKGSDLAAYVQRTLTSTLLIALNAPIVKNVRLNVTSAISIWSATGMQTVLPNFQIS